MKPAPLPNVDRLNELFTLDTKRGVLLHRKKCGIKSGSIAGNVMPQGYRRVKVDGKLYLSHRLIYAMAYGDCPQHMEVDHINGNKSDSRPENLRLATRSQNRHNVDTYANNSTNKKGTWYDKRRKAFFCAVQCNGLREQFGPFETLLEASNTYCREAKERFGNFYRSESV